MAGGVFLLFILDFLYTTAIAVGASWFYTSRYLASRTSNHLGKGDVALLRRMRDELQALNMLDEMGIITVPEQNRARIHALVTQHDNTKELPQ